MSECRAAFSIILCPWLEQNRSDACWDAGDNPVIFASFSAGDGKAGREQLFEMPSRILPDSHAPRFREPWQGIDLIDPDRRVAQLVSKAAGGVLRCATLIC
jgi:hypothetical protein